jgi:hypothetical protein
MPRGQKEESRYYSKTHKLEVDFKEKEKGPCQKDVEIGNYLPVSHWNIAFTKFNQQIQYTSSNPNCEISQSKDRSGRRLT